MSIGLVLKSLFLSIWLFFIPVEPLIVLVGAFIVADTIMGLYTAWRLKEPIVSRKLSRLAIKLLLYTGATLLVYGLDTLIISDIFGLDSSKFIFTKITVGALCSIELFSIDEKIRKFNDEKGFKFYWKRTLALVKGIKKDINDINEK